MLPAAAFQTAPSSIDTGGAANWAQIHRPFLRRGDIYIFDGPAAWCRPVSAAEMYCQREGEHDHERFVG